MGYYSNKEIASVVEPNGLTLANNPNFVVFSGLNTNQNQTKCFGTIQVLRVGNRESNLRIEITEIQSGQKHTFYSTYDESKINDNTFYIVAEGSKYKGSDSVFSESKALVMTAENLKICLLKNSFIRNNFDVSVNTSEVLTEAETNIQVVYESNIITLKAKGYGTESNISIQTLYDNVDFIDPDYTNTEKFDKIAGIISDKSEVSDTIDYGTGSYRIDLEVYTNHGIYPGNGDGLNMGNYLTTLSKSYFGKPLWFDLSMLLSKKASYSPAFLTQLELDPQDSNYRLWSNADTMTDYRFIAKRTDGTINEPFFYSSPLYVLNGYDYTLNPLKLTTDDDGNSYILDFSQTFYDAPFTKVKPLTTSFSRTHIKGQRQYFNFIHNYILTSTRVGGVDNPLPSIGLHYKLYTQMGKFIKEYTHQGQSEGDFNKVNTALLQLDRFLPMHEGCTVGRIDVYLCTWHKSVALGFNKPEVLISTPLSFRILPEHIHDVNDFVFLNRLGGWDTMNFGGSSSSEFKTAGSTIYKTLQPDFNLQTEIESVATKSVQQQQTVQTSPITADVVDWLRQMSASPAVYELKTKRYILIDDMVLKYNSTDDLYQVEMKYHYTDTFK